MIELMTESENGVTVAPEIVADIKRVCERIMENEECDFDAQISLTFTDNDGIRRINNEFRGIDKATDVLSFPMLEFEDGEADAEFETDDGLVMLGDIVISKERAREQATEFGHTLRREMAFLAAHSMLHLLGYDHVDDPEGERQMIQKQDAALTALGLTRDLREEIYEK